MRVKLARGSTLSILSHFQTHLVQQSFFLMRETVLTSTTNYNTGFRSTLCVLSHFQTRLVQESVFNARNCLQIITLASENFPVWTTDGHYVRKQNW